MAIEPNRRQRLAILGATGSIGASTLDLVRRHPDRFEVVALSAHRDHEGLLRLVEAFKPKVVCLSDPLAAEHFRQALGQSSQRHVFGLAGPEGLCELAGLAEVDTVVAGIVGVAGLPSVWRAVAAGKRVLLANKEALVCAGGLMVAQAASSGATILPIDSEHNAIFQALGPGYRCFEQPTDVRRILLTASGGPFRSWWTMGKKITVDSATMANKGLEWIEAHWLFAMPPQDIEIVVHPESVIHSMVEFEDGSTLAQLGPPDMRTPIAHAMAWPQRINSGVTPLDWRAIKALHFEEPDPIRFPALGHVAACLEQGQAAGNVFNAANEQAVDAFLAGRIRFGQIQNLVGDVLSELVGRVADPTSVDDVIDIDSQARRHADAWLMRHSELAS
ncbi:MAG: 1-deoxy-D-xylulose-5-phosphate reductoisomerase [Burkholderiaceae bacterium]